MLGEMNTTSPDGNHHPHHYNYKSSSINASQNNKQSKVPTVETNGLAPDQDKSTSNDKVPKTGLNTGPPDLDNTNLAKLYESSNNTVAVVREEHFNNSTCDLTMSPVEGPISDLPQTNLMLRDGEKSISEQGCEEFSGQIVYNPDGSAYILEESDETLLDQIPTQEGAIVERPGKAVSQVAEYPKIDQATYIARRKAWYNAFGTAYMQLMKGKRAESPNIHNFKVVSVEEKINSCRRKHEDKPLDEVSQQTPGKVQTINFKTIFSLITFLLSREIKIIFNAFLTFGSKPRPEDLECNKPSLRCE